MMQRSDFLRSGGAALMAALVAGCMVSAPTPAPQEYHDDSRKVSVSAQNAALINEGGPVFGAPTVPDGGQLINEGGPVFALPGSIRLPSYVSGDVSTLTIKAERTDGGAFPGVEAAKVGTDGSFTLRGPITSELFFAATEFMYEDRLHRVRALARAQSGEAIVLDVASSLISAKVALAAQKRTLDALDYNETTEITAQVRSTLKSSLGAVKLDQPNEALSAQLTTLAKKSEPLSVSLGAWETTVLGLPKPTPSPAPSGSPSPQASESPNLEPVK